jgi:hypothetical protein
MRQRIVGISASAQSWTISIYLQQGCKKDGGGISVLDFARSAVAGTKAICYLPAQALAVEIHVVILWTAGMEQAREEG